MDKHIRFGIIEHKPKTKVWGVFKVNDGERLGVIKWFGGWRQYVFVPDEYTCFSCGCLRDVSEFIVRANKKHEAQRGKQDLKEVS